MAGGEGTRLYPLTSISSKQLQPVYDKPMIYYPLTALIAAGINDICIIVSPNQKPSFENLFGNGKQLGISLKFLTQDQPVGIAEAFIIAQDFIGLENVCLVLGDNIFSGGSDFPDVIDNFNGGAEIFAYHVKHPEKFGVIQFDADGNAISIEEKPQNPKSNFAIPGVYIYDRSVVEIAKSIKPSKRGELEITEINKVFLDQGLLKVHRLSRGFIWLDAGSSTSLHAASVYVEMIEKIQGYKIGSPEEAAYQRNFISRRQFDALIHKMPDCEYKRYLMSV